MDRVGTAPTQYRQLLDQYKVENIRMTATSAARDATNSKDFFDMAEEIIGVRPELLTGIEEGNLSFIRSHKRTQPRTRTVSSDGHRWRFYRICIWLTRKSRNHIV